MRVFELARDLGQTSKELLAVLEKLGIAVEDHAAELDVADEKKVRQKLTRPAPVRKKKKAAPAPEPEPVAAAPKARVVVRRRRAEKPPVEAPEPVAEAPAPVEPEPVVQETVAAEPEPIAAEPTIVEPEPAVPVEVATSTVETVAKVAAPTPKAPEKPVRKSALPSAEERVRRAQPGSRETPKGLTPHMDVLPDAPKKRVVIDLPPEKPAVAKVAKPEKREKKKGREAESSAPAPGQAPAPGTDARGKRKWQSFKGKKSKGRGREEHAAGAFSRPHKGDAQEASAPRVRAIRIQEGTTVKEFADSLGLKVSIIIAELMKMGAMATLNDPIDMDAAQLIADAMDVKMDIVLDKTEDERLDVVEDTEDSLKERAPVVTIMGHVDHGKTSLLDAIRNSRVTAREAGGITQHIGAYAVETERGKVVFLDTPGHAAFTAMRARGAQYTDIVVLVVAADDGVMPQTVEAIHHAKNAGVPIIVAVNKIDKPEANPDRVLQAISEHELVPEEWGGDVLVAKVSAQTQEGIPDLLEKILLQAEIMDLKANPDKPAIGVVVEGRLDRGRGPVATVLIRGGTLRVGDFFVTGNHTGRVRAMTDDMGNRLEVAVPATPVEIIGLEGVPMAGDPFNAVTNEKAAKEVADDRRQKQRSRELAREKKMSLDDLFSKMQEDQEVVDLPLVLRGDVQGSLEAISDALLKMPSDKVKVKVLHSGVGGITETDIMLAAAGDAIVIGFSVRPEPKAAKLAEQEGVDVRLYNVIYNLTDDVRAAMEGLLAPLYKERSLGRAEVREVFKVPRAGQVAGCYVTEGEILRGSAGLRVVRDNVVVHEGPLLALRRFKDDVKEVKAGYECGISFERYNDIKVGDIIEAFAMDEEAAKL